MTFLLFLVSVAVLDQLLIRRQPARKTPESEAAPPKSKAAGAD